MDKPEKDVSASNFMGNLNSMLAVKTDFEKKEYNYTWISEFEDVLHYLDNILRNPKRFIVNEEDIVKIELAKKVTVESVIHLTQHTNLIQDIDKKSGDVRPSKILNINKDESLDTYENRFIYTLINNMNSFYQERINNLTGESYYYDKKELKYEGSTKIGTEQVNISLLFNSLDKNTIEPNDGNEETIPERLKKIKQQIDGFLGTELMVTLGKMHISAVRSPIRKTNVILKNPNFQKAVTLWNYIQSYDTEDCKVVKNNQDYIDGGELKTNYDHSFLLSYLNNDILNSNNKKISERKAMALAMNGLIENIFNCNEDVTQETVKKLFNKTLKETGHKVNTRDKIIASIFEERLSKINDDIKQACLILRQE